MSPEPKINLLDDPKTGIKVGMAALKMYMDRYDGDASRVALKQAYLPFGMGPRVCMGAAFALQEATLILAQLSRLARQEVAS